MCLIFENQFRCGSAFVEKLMSALLHGNSGAIAVLFQPADMANAFSTRHSYVRADEWGGSVDYLARIYRECRANNFGNRYAESDGSAFDEDDSDAEEPRKNSRFIPLTVTNPLQHQRRRLSAPKQRMRKSPTRMISPRTRKTKKWSSRRTMRRTRMPIPRARSQLVLRRTGR